MKLPVIVPWLLRLFGIEIYPPMPKWAVVDFGFGFVLNEIVCEIKTRRSGGINRTDSPMLLSPLIGNLEYLLIEKLIHGSHLADTVSTLMRNTRCS